MTTDNTSGAGVAIERMEQLLGHKLTSGQKAFAEAAYNNPDFRLRFNWPFRQYLEVKPELLPDWMTF